MRAVSVRDLKNGLSELLRAVRAGETILVTHGDEVVAEIHPPAEPPAHEDLSPGIAALVRDGSLTLGTGNRDSDYPTFSRLAPGIDALDLLDEERGTR